MTTKLSARGELEADRKDHQRRIHPGDLAQHRPQVRDREQRSGAADAETSTVSSRRRRSWRPSCAGATAGAGRAEGAKPVAPAPWGAAPARVAAGGKRWPTWPFRSRAAGAAVFLDELRVARWREAISSATDHRRRICAAGAAGADPIPAARVGRALRRTSSADVRRRDRPRVGGGTTSGAGSRSGHRC